MRQRAGSLAIGWAMAAVGCGDVVTVPDLAPPPVIEGLLLADSLRSTFRIGYAATTDGADLSPIAPDSVDLALASGAVSARLIAVPDSAGFFRAELAIRRGGRYRLTGTVAGRSIHAETIVPSAFTIDEPADPVVVTLDEITTPFRWHAEGAGGFLALGARLSPLAANATRDTIGLIYLDPRERSKSSIQVIAITAETHAYFFALTGRGNVHGGFGVLGGGIATHRAVRWQ
jgi:hypothetical protein